MSYVLLWCWASLSHAACEPQGFYDSLAACQQAQQEAQRFDNRAIAVSGLPVLVRYHCDGEGGADEAPFALRGAEARAGKKARQEVVHISRRHHGHLGQHAADGAWMMPVTRLDRVAMAVDGAESSNGKNIGMWRPDPSGPQGPMQVSEAAAMDVGGGDRFDLTQNRAIGRAYLAQLYGRYKNWPDAIAAYNWGLSNVDTWIKAGRPREKLVAGVASYTTRVLRDSGLCDDAAIAAPVTHSPFHGLEARDAASTENRGYSCADTNYSIDALQLRLKYGPGPSTALFDRETALARSWRIAIRRLGCGITFADSLRCK